MTHDEIFNECVNNLTRESIIRLTIRDGEKPMGFLLTYLKDVYWLPKPDGWHIAEALLEHFNINNEDKIFQS